MRTLHARSGQSLIDVLIASGLGAILLVGALSVLAPALRGTSDAEYAQDGAAYARGLQDSVRALAAANWNAVASLTPGATYYLEQNATSASVVSGVESSSGVIAGLVGHWKLDDATGTVAADASGNGYSGTLFNSPTWSAGQLDGALSFNPATFPRVGITDRSALRPNTLTVSAWLNPTVLDTAWQSAVSKTNNGSWTDGWGLVSYVGGANKIYFFVNDYASYYVSTTLPTGSWSHVAATYDGATIKLYLNGALVDSRAYSASITSATGELQIGDAQGYSWNGKIDDVRIYNTALTVAQIPSLMTVAGAGGTASMSRSFAVYPVKRNSSGVVVDTGGYTDPSTLRLVVTYQWPRGTARTLTSYLTRSRSNALLQSDWSGGPTLTGTTTNPGAAFATSTGIDATSTTGAISIDFNTAQSTSSGGGGGATNISATSSLHFGWNDILGWINFYSDNTVNVKSTRVEGSAASIAGPISLDCATSPAGNICGTSNYYVTNDGAGTLAGYAWNDTYGWISFNCSNNSGCGSSSYSVSINPSTGDFSGYAWNDLVGWISFNCVDLAICGTSDYKVQTSWRAGSASGYLDSAIIDTGSVNGAQVNGVSWTGLKPSGTDVRIQIATSSSSSGPWNYVGNDGSGSSYYIFAPGGGAALYPWIHGSGRYFRYRIWLVSDAAQSTSPTVNSVVVRWSP